MSGQHSMRLGSRGIEVFPRLLPTSAFKQEFKTQTVSSGIPDLDALIHGGLDRGTINIITGPSGVGKTTLGVQFMKEAAKRGERSVIYSFEEWAGMIIRRSEGVNIPIKAMIERGTLSIIEVEPLLYSPDEFARIVRDDVTKKGASIVMIDSIAGYRLSLRGEDLVRHLHALSKYLQGMGVTVLLINETEEVVGEFRITDAKISYIADTIIFMRYLELRGELRRAIGVLKKRLSNFEKALREYEITPSGIKVGKPLTDLRGILSGNPRWESDEA
jgi:circadian clock protein KaiC